MKKTLLAVGVLGAFSTMAFAASNVTLYGVIDTSVVMTHGGGKAGENININTVDMQSGFRAGSRWGIMGVEDLGNGYAVGFILEDGFDSDSGANGQKYYGGFSREAKLYVQGAFGQLGFGRLGTLANGAQSNNILSGYALGTSYQTQGTWTAYAKNFGRANNAVAYVSPSFAGFTLHAMYSNGIGSAKDGVVTNGDTNKWSKNSHYYGLGLAYEVGGYRNVLIFEAGDNKGATEAKDRDDAYSINLGLGYNLGAITPQFAYQYAWQDNHYKQNVFGLSATAPVAGGTVKVGAKYLMGKDETVTAGEDKYRSLTLSAAYEYPLSKRTVVYGFGSWADGSKLMSASNLRKNSKIGGSEIANKANYDGFVFAIGMGHNF